MLYSISDNLWEEMLVMARRAPLDFAHLEDQYDVGKLDLHKITAHEICAKRVLFESRQPDYEGEGSKTWMENQYRIFMWFLLAYLKLHNRSPDNFTQQEWNIVGRAFQKFPYVCQYFYFFSKKKKSSSWSPEQDQIVEKLMKTQMNKKWTSIGLELYRVTNGKRIKKPKAVRERWLSHLNPDIKRQDWTPEQEQQLVRKIREHGKKWSKIATMLGCRSEHTIKNRFHKLLLRLKKKYANLGQYTQQEILDLMAKDITQKSANQTRSRKNTTQQLVESEAELCGDSGTRNETEPVMESCFKNSHIFHPIVIIFGEWSIR